MDFNELKQTDAFLDFKLNHLSKLDLFVLLRKANMRRKSAERRIYKLRGRMRRINDYTLDAIKSRQHTIEEQWEVMRELQRRGIVATEELEKVLWDVMKVKPPKF